jgi:MoaA/NifB/PqqE/SkfB family radical SAM enzyme
MAGFPLTDQADPASFDPQPVAAEIKAAFNAQRSCRDKSLLCHAPTSSLYFGRDGSISACCYSRDSAFGRFPEDSIAATWHGAGLRAMRAQLQRDILPSGCGKCADQFRARNFRGLMAANFDACAPSPTARSRIDALFGARVGALVGAKPHAPWTYPVQMEFELSNRCNLECAMCTGSFSSLIRANRERLPPLADVYDARFVEQLREFVPHLKRAKFLGGEPFLIDIYYAIWDLFIAFNPDCLVSITTNATAFSPKVQRVLDGLNFWIVVSLDSLDAGIYASIRQHARLDRTLANFERILAASRERGKSVSIAICPMANNWRGLPDLVSFANDRELSVYFNTVTYPAGLTLRDMPADEQEAALAFLRASVPPRPSGVAVANYAALRDVCQQLEMWMLERGKLEAV